MVTPFKRYQLLLRSLLGVVLLVIGILSSYDHLVVGYDPQSEGIVLYNQIFRNLHNAIMLSYMGIFIRLSHIIIGLLLLSKKYWWFGSLLHMPIAVNIFFIHIFHDLPPTHGVFFGIGMLVSISTFLLFFSEKRRVLNLLKSD